MITWLIKISAFRGGEAALILRQTTNIRNSVSGQNDNKKYFERKDDHEVDTQHIFQNLDAWENQSLPYIFHREGHAYLIYHTGLSLVHEYH